MADDIKWNAVVPALYFSAAVVWMLVRPLAHLIWPDEKTPKGWRKK